MEKAEGGLSTLPGLAGLRSGGEDDALLQDLRRIIGFVSILETALAGNDRDPGDAGGPEAGTGPSAGRPAQAADPGARLSDLREDNPGPTLERDRLLEAAPETEDGCFRTPAALGKGGAP